MVNVDDKFYRLVYVRLVFCVCFQSLVIHVSITLTALMLFTDLSAVECVHVSAASRRRRISAYHAVSNLIHCLN